MRERCQICGCATSLWMGALLRPQGRGPPLCPMAEEEGHVSGRQGMECPESWHITLCLKVVLSTATQSWSCSEVSEGRAVPAAAFCPLTGCRKMDTALIQPPHCKRDGFTLVLPMVSQHSDAFLVDQGMGQEVTCCMSGGGTSHPPSWHCPRGRRWVGAPCPGMAQGQS